MALCHPCSLSASASASLTLLHLRLTIHPCATKNTDPSLGDRHCENILFDETSGDTVHVDLNCLFDKGRTFEIPEKVPFRLTQNLVDALGVTGVEGVFRKAAEITMGILRNNSESLMSVLEAFAHDPLVEWSSRVSLFIPRDSMLRNDQLISAEQTAQRGNDPQSCREELATHPRQTQGSIR